MLSIFRVKELEIFDTSYEKANKSFKPFSRGTKEKENGPKISNWDENGVSPILLKIFFFTGNFLPQPVFPQLVKNMFS